MAVGFVDSGDRLRSRYDQIEREVNRQCRRYLPLPSAREDVIQQVYVLLLEQWGDRFTDRMQSDDADVEQVIRDVIFRAIGQASWREQKRRQRKLPSQIPDEDSTIHPNRPGLDVETVAELRIAFQNMSQVERRLIAMRRQGVSIRDICRRLEIGRRRYDFLVARLERRLLAALS